MKNLVFDTWPIVELIEGDEFAGKVEQILAYHKDQQYQLLISAVNLGEVWYSTARSYSTEVADETISEIKKVGFSVIEIGWPLTKIAARYKLMGGISYADCFAAALAKDRNAPLVTGDPEFKQLEDVIDLIWIS